MSEFDDSVEAVDYLLVNRSPDREHGLELSTKLRSRGRKVLCLIRDIQDRELGAYASAHSIGRILILDDEGLSILSTENLGKKPCDIDEL